MWYCPGDGPMPDMVQLISGSWGEKIEKKVFFFGKNRHFVKTVGIGIWHLDTFLKPIGPILPSA
jgi:hypothetical protein